MTRRPARQSGIAFGAALAAAFVFRLMYGWSMPFWSEDERQVYLIGLRSFARGDWPYFGADVVWTGGQVPGALLGMLVRAPLELWPIPESPFILLNILSFAALAFFAWYLSRRLAGVPPWLIWAALLTLPWTLNFSTHVVNPSYVLPGAIVFFVGFFEGWPAMRRRLLPFATAWAMMGAGLCFVMQLHMSWVLLPPYVAVAVLGLWMSRPERLETTRARALVGAAVGFIAGAAITGSLLLPTILRYGIGAGDVEGAVTFRAQSPFGLVTTAARVLSFASFETNRFLGMSTGDRVLVLSRHLWMAPFVAIVALAGVIHPLWMVVTAFRRRARDSTDWTLVRGLLAATIVLIYVSFFFSVRGPQAHSIYLAFPVAALFAFACWQTAAEAPAPRRRRWERVAAAVIVSGIVVHTALAIDRWPRQSLYADRSVVAAAIAQRNDRFLGDRRDTAIEMVDHRPRPIDPVADAAAYLAARPEEDLRLLDAAWSPVVGGVSRFRVTIANRGRSAAWLDIRYQTSYTDAAGRQVATNDGVIKRILQPGGTLAEWDIADGFVPPGATAAAITVVGAERCIPAGR